LSHTRPSGIPDLPKYFIDRILGTGPQGAKHSVQTLSLVLHFLMAESTRERQSQDNPSHYTYHKLELCP